MAKDNLGKKDLLVSVIVPVYNAADYLERCLNSIIRQSYAHIEIVLVNDGSTDNSLEIMESYARMDRRIVIFNQDNKGVAAARNTGIKNIRGDLFLFVDSDDWIEGSMITRMLELLDDTVDIVFCDSDHAENEENAKKIGKVLYEEWDQKEQQYQFMLHKRMTGMLWNKLIRSSLIENVSFDETVGYGEDAQFLWKVLKNSKKMVVTNEILYHHVLEERSISHQIFNDNKFSAIIMWENLVDEVQVSYPELAGLAKERLMSAVVYSYYEAKQCGYADQDKLGYMCAIVRSNLILFLKSPRISVRMKLYATYVCLRSLYKMREVKN